MSFDQVVIFGEEGGKGVFVEEIFMRNDRSPLRLVATTKRPDVVTELNHVESF